LRLGVVDRRLVVLGHAELEILGGVTDVLFQLLHGLELLLDVRAHTQEGLRFRLIVPESGRAGLLV
jgi:hypothetical protein